MKAMSLAYGMGGISDLDSTTGSLLRATIGIPELRHQDKMPTMPGTSPRWVCEPIGVFQTKTPLRFKAAAIKAEFRIRRFLLSLRARRKPRFLLRQGCVEETSSPTGRISFRLLQARKSSAIVIGQIG